MSKMTLAQISLAANALRSQVRAGVPLAEAVERMQDLQPAYADFWREGAKAMSRGTQLTRIVAEVWPEAIVAAVNAGEESGRMDEVLEQVEQTIAMQLKIRDAAMQLLYPAGLMLAGMAVFVFFMVWVLPGMAKAMRSTRHSFVFELSALMQSMVFDYGWMILAMVVLGGQVIVSWVKSEAGRQAMLDYALRMPVLGKAVSELAFGLWAKYLALTTGAGIPTQAAVRATAAILPWRLQESADVFAQDLARRNKSLRQAADINKLPADDPRVRWWPFFISNAWMLAEQTGNVEEAMQRASPELMAMGVTSLTRAIKFAYAIALAIAGTLIMTPLGAYYFEMLTAVGKLR